MIYECQATILEPKYLKLVYRESVKSNKPYNLFMRVSEKLQFYADDNQSPLGYIELDGLKVKGVKVWDEDRVRKEAKLQTKMARKLSKKQKKSKSKGKDSKQKNKDTNRNDQSGNKNKEESKESKSNGNKEEVKEENLPLLETNQSSQSNRYETSYNFVVYKDGHKDADDVIILEIHTQSRALKTALEKISTYSAKKSSNPLSFQPNKQFNASLMSSENHQQRYRGFLNLAMILLVVLNLRNIVANLHKYGLQEWPALNMCYHTYIFLTLVLGGHIAFCHTITKLWFKKSISNIIAILLNVLNIAGLLVLNVAYSKYFDPGVFASNLLTMLSSIVTLKLISYLHFNASVLKTADLLKNNPYSPEMLEVDEFVKGEIKANLDDISQTLTLYRLGYFVMAPTLCYQLEYPRNTYIRKGWLAKRLVEYVLSSLVMNIVIIQYVLPELADIREYYVKPQFKVSEFAYMILELSVPVMIFWVTMFYSFFHVLLNIIGQLTRFGDRSFYLDWWNCKDHDQYWRKWNLPVHNWMLRHIYIPLTGAGVSKSAAGFAVFFVSALYHEYWIGVPLQILSFWAFLAIMSQAPLINFQKVMEKRLGIRNSELGNVVFWVSFCFVGQPLVVFAYYYLYTSK